MFPDFLPQRIAVDAKNVGCLGLVTLHLLKDHFEKRPLNSVYDEIMKLAAAIAVHFGYILLYAFIKPSFEKRMNFAADLSHGEWDADTSRMR